jgi:serine/threonine-protein kinase RsbW
MSMTAQPKSKTEETACPVPRAPGGLWFEVSLRRGEEVVFLLDDVEAVMTQLGYPTRDAVGLRLALEEGIVNGLRHGNGGDPAKQVVVRCAIGLEEALAEVEDEGPGFDPGQVPDPTAPENLDKPSGRGLLLMRHFTTWMRYNRRGNRVTLCKRRTAQGPAGVPLAAAAPAVLQWRTP